MQFGGVGSFGSDYYLPLGSVRVRDFVYTLAETTAIALVYLEIELLGYLQHLKAPELRVFNVVSNEERLIVVIFVVRPPTQHSRLLVCKTIQWRQPNIDTPYKLIRTTESVTP